MAGVYFSYPFCAQKCSFCNFASNVGSKGERDSYHAALLAEVRSHEWSWRPETVYFGGGTPSLMPPELLADLIQSLPVDHIGESTLECAPGTVTAPLAQAWRDCGINRVSLGVQSFVQAELSLTGRRHSAAVVESDLETLRAAGISNVSIDLIAGLPEQTRASWEESLNWLERLRVPHASIYVFEADDESRLGKELLLGGVRYGAARMPSDDLVAELYECAVARLAQIGLDRYEISNFACDGFASRHNLKYWQLEPYIGFGLDAHSFDGTSRWSNPDTLGEYLDRVEDRIERIATDSSEEHFFVGLRLTNGIEPTPAEWQRFEQPIAKWMKAGMLKREGSHLRLSPQGVLLSNEIFEEFVA